MRNALAHDPLVGWAGKDPFNLRWLRPGSVVAHACARQPLQIALRNCGTAESDYSGPARLAAESSKLRKALRTLRKAQPQCVRQCARAFKASARLFDWRSRQGQMQRERSPATAPTRAGRRGWRPMRGRPSHAPWLADGSPRTRQAGAVGPAWHAGTHQPSAGSVLRPCASATPCSAPGQRVRRSRRPSTEARPMPCRIHQVSSLPLGAPPRAAHGAAYHLL